MQAACAAMRIVAAELEGGALQALIALALLRTPHAIGLQQSLDIAQYAHAS